MSASVGWKPVKAVQVVAVADRISSEPVRFSPTPAGHGGCERFETQDTVQGAQRTKARRFRPGSKPLGTPAIFSAADSVVKALRASFDQENCSPPSWFLPRWRGPCTPGFLDQPCERHLA